MRIFITGFLAVCCCTAVEAAELGLLAGYQLNSDFELADVNGSNFSASIGDDVAVEDASALGLTLDFVYPRNRNQRIGLWASTHQSNFDSRSLLADDQLRVSHLHFTSMTYFPNGKWEPFILAGVGAAHYAPEDKSLRKLTRFSAQIGGGSNLRITEQLLFRLEARWIPTFFGGSADIFCSGGCIISVRSSEYSQFQANLGLLFRF